MPYRELQFTVGAEIAEPLGDALMEIGALSVSVEDAAAGGYDENPLYGEPGLSPEVQAWDLSSVKALFSKDLDLPLNDLVAELKEAGFSVNQPQEVIIADQDWVRLTQSQFEPIHVGSESGLFRPGTKRLMIRMPFVWQLILASHLELAAIPPPDSV